MTLMTASNAITCIHGINGLMHCRPCRNARANERNAEKRARGLTQRGNSYQTMPYGTPAAVRVLARTDRSTGCWVFMGPVTRIGGYGRIRDGRKTRMAHVVVYEAMVGPVPEGLQLDHVFDRGCRSKACVNPDHLEPVTTAENQRRNQVALGREHASERMRKAWATRRARSAAEVS